MDPSELCDVLACFVGVTVALFTTSVLWLGSPILHAKFRARYISHYKSCATCQMVQPLRLVEVSYVVNRVGGASMLSLVMARTTLAGRPFASG